MGKLFWLASYPKSGNTWVRVFLAHWYHGQNVDINRLDEAGMSIRETWPDAWRMFFGGQIPDIARQTADRFMVQRFIAEQRGGVSFCKTHNACVTFRGHPMIDKFVTAGALYIVRDPRDVCLSMMRHANIGEEEAVERINGFSTATSTPDGVFEYLSDWSTHVKSWEWAPKVRYEDLWLKKWVHFDKIVRCIGGESDLVKLGKAIDASYLWRMRDFEAKHGFSEALNGNFFGEGGSTWRKRLSSKAADAIWKHNSEMMERNGYKGTRSKASVSGYRARAMTTA